MGLGEGGGASTPAASSGPGVAPGAAPGTGEGASGASSSSSAGAAAAPVTAETFGWDAWDGAAFDAFPEEARPWVERASGYFTPRLREARENADLVAFLKEHGGTDEAATRFAEERQGWATEREQAAKQTAEYQAKIAAYEARQAEQDLAEQEAWITANREWLDTPGARAAVTALLGPEPAEGAPERIALDQVAAVVKLGREAGDLQKAVKLAEEMLAEGIPAASPRFMRLLQAEMGVSAGGPAAAGAPAAAPAAAAVPAPVARPTADLTGSGAAHGASRGAAPRPRGVQGIAAAVGDRLKQAQRG